MLDLAIVCRASNSNRMVATMTRATDRVRVRDKARATVRVRARVRDRATTRARVRSFGARIRMPLRDPQGRGPLALPLGDLYPPAGTPPGTRLLTSRAKEGHRAVQGSKARASPPDPRQPSE